MALLYQVVQYLIAAREPRSQVPVGYSILYIQYPNTFGASGYASGLYVGYRIGQMLRKLVAPFVAELLLIDYHRRLSRLVSIG